MPVVDGRPGRAFDLRDRSVDADAVAAAIAADQADDDRDDDVEIRCPAPGRVHERVGVLRPARAYPLQAALAAVARRLGHRPPQADALREVGERLAAIDPPDVSLADERRRLAETDDAAGLTAEVATLRGQVDAARERGEDPDALLAARERAVTDLAERRTERLAAEQILDRARERAREARDRREERLRLEDRERNLERASRRALAERLQPAFERALAAVPGSARPGDTPGSVDGDDVDGALAVCRVADLTAPVVVAVDRFPTATAAAAALDAPVVLVDG